MTYASTRGLITEALTESGYTISGTVVSDGGGGGSVTAVNGGTVACRIDVIGATSAGESTVANRISDRSTHILTLPPGSSVTTEDQFYVIGRGTYEVTAVREHTGEFSTVFEAVEFA